MKSSKFLSFLEDLEDTFPPKSVFSLFHPTSLPSSLQNSENKKVARLKSTSLICGAHLSNVCAKFELGLFIRPIPTLLFLAIAAIIWKPSSFNDRNDRNTMIAAIVAIVWKPGFRVLMTNKAVGLDKIGTRLLKDSADVITPSLTNLLQ